MFLDAGVVFEVRVYEAWSRGVECRGYVVLERPLILEADCLVSLHAKST